jgi:RNA polymerase sigma-70 factor (ECF subfamily)
MIDTALDDAQVVAASLREPERFAVLFHRYAPELGRYIGRRLGREAVLRQEPHD